MPQPWRFEPCGKVIFHLFGRKQLNSPILVEVFVKKTGHNWRTSGKNIAVRPVAGAIHLGEGNGPQRAPRFLLATEHMMT